MAAQTVTSETAVKGPTGVPATMEQADSTIAASEAHLAELEARLKRGEKVSASEYGDAEIQVRVDKVRRNLLKERLAEEAEAVRVAAIESLRGEASSRIDRGSYERALEKFGAATREFFEAAKAYEERVYAVRDQLRMLAPLPAGINETIRGLEIDGAEFRQPNPNGDPMKVMSREFKSAFPRRENKFSA